MKKMKARIAVFSSLIAVTGALLVAGTARAQGAQLNPIPNDPRMDVIPVRTQAEITKDINNTNATKVLSEARRGRAEDRLQQLDRIINDRKRAVSDVDRQKKDAKQAKRGTEAVGLELKQKADQQAVNLLDKLKDLRNSEVDAATAETELADAQIGALLLEAELARKRTENDSLAVAGLGNLSLSSNQQVLGELEARLLKLQKQQAEAAQNVASKWKDIVSRRTELHEAQLKMGMPRA